MKADISTVNLVIALKHQDQMVDLVIALKSQVPQMIQFVTNQVDMPLDFRDTPKEMALLTNQVKLIKNCLQIKLLTHQVGAAQTKKTVPTVAKTKALAAGVCAAQQNEYDNATGCWITADDTNAGPKLLMAARTPLFTAASKGHTAIVAKLVCRFQRKIAGSILR